MRRGLSSLGYGLLAASLWTMAPATQALSATAFETAKQTGTVTVGLANEKPYAYIETDGKVTGAIVEVLRAALEPLGITKIEANVNEFSALVPGVMAGRFDIIGAGMYVTPKRCESIAFTNPLTNSYKRRVPGYEAPVLLAYSARNRSASCRIPFGSSPKSKRVEVRFPDPGANPYLAFASLLMAGLDGIKNKIHPGQPMDKDLYDLPPKELKKIPTVCGSLREALQSLDKDRGFLKAGGVFDDDLIDSYIELKMAEVMRFEMTPHPVEYDMYYSV